MIIIGLLQMEFTSVPPLDMLWKCAIHAFDHLYHRRANKDLAIAVEEMFALMGIRSKQACNLVLEFCNEMESSEVIFLFSSVIVVELLFIFII